MRRISISVLGVSATPLKTIPALLEESDLFEFTLGPEPIIKLIAWEAVTLKINLISASSDFFRGLARDLQKFLLPEADWDWRHAPESHFSCLSMS